MGHGDAAATNGMEWNGMIFTLSERLDRIPSPLLSDEEPIFEDPSGPSSTPHVGSSSPVVTLHQCNGTHSLFPTEPQLESQYLILRPRTAPIPSKPRLLSPLQPCKPQPSHSSSSRFYPPAVSICAPNEPSPSLYVPLPLHIQRA